MHCLAVKNQKYIEHSHPNPTGTQFWKKKSEAKGMKDIKQRQNTWNYLKDKKIG